MDDAAVVARLVGGDLRFLVEDDHARLRVPLGEGERGGKADDAAADDGDIRGLAHGAENTTPLDSRAPHLRSGRVASGAGERSGEVGPPKPVRRPQGGVSGEWVTQRARPPAPDDGPRPASRSAYS